MPNTATAGTDRRVRTQRERSAATRARILEAVIASIDEVGFARTTAQRIARGAGVSVGAVQHHFATKDDVLAAVLLRSVRNLEAQFADIGDVPGPLGERISLFVDRAWRHYGSAAFRSTAEILLNSRELAAGADGRRHAPPILASAHAAARLWVRFFGDLPLPRRRQREIRQFAFAALTGLANTGRFQSPEPDFQPQVGMLKTSLAAVFERALAGAGGS